MTSRTHRSPKERDARCRAVQLLADKPLLRGPLVLQHRSCGKSYCRCQTGQKHPALYLHTRFGDQRVRIYIPSALQETVRSAIENGRQIDHLSDPVSDSTSRPSWSRSRRSSPARAAAEPRAPDRDGTVLRLCREGLSTGEAILDPDRLSTPPRITTAAVFAAVFTLFATRRGSLNGLDQDLRIPARLRGIVGAKPPSVDSIGRISALMDSQPLRQLLRDIAHRLKPNKALIGREGWYVAAVDGHEFLSSRKRCCPQCQSRTLTVDGQPVTEYFHQGVVCHLIGQDLALVLDVELLRPGEGEETAAKRLLERVFTHYPRFFDVVVADELYFDAPLINFCLDHHKHVIVTAKGDHRLLVQDAAGLFAQQQAGGWVDQKGRRTVQFWDEEGFTSCEGVKRPLRVLRTVETVRRRERVAGQWRETAETTTWSWATTLTKTQLSPRGLWRCGHARWDIEHDCFNTLATHWGLNHCFKHAATAIVNFLLTSFVVYALLQGFWLRNLKPARSAGLTLIGLTRELDRSVCGCWAPWSGRLARAP